MIKVYTTALSLLLIICILFLIYKSLTIVNKYINVDIRKLENGHILKKTVIENKNICEKKVELFNKYGILLKHNKRQTSSEHCNAIVNGQFVQNLWKDCSI